MEKEILEIKEESQEIHEKTQEEILTKEEILEENLLRNLHKLKPGETSYKDLCNLLEQPYYTGNQKIKQLLNFERYFSFEKSNRKLNIKEIYSTPKGKEYKYPANSLYIECIEKILLTYLSRQDETVYISSQYLFLTLGMINYDYINMLRPDRKKKLKQDLKDNINIEEDVSIYINDFYTRCRSKFSDILETSLKSLQKRRLIEYSTVYHMYYDIYDEYGNKLNEYNHYSNDSEVKNLLAIEREVLDLYGLDNEGEVWLRHKNEEFYKEVTKRARKIYPGLKGIYKCYKFIFNQKHIEKAITRHEEKLKKKELNEKILTFIDNQAKRNYLGDSDNYLKAQFYLSDKLIKIQIN